MGIPGFPLTDLKYTFWYRNMCYQSHFTSLTNCYILQLLTSTFPPFNTIHSLGRKYKWPYREIAHSPLNNTRCSERCSYVAEMSCSGTKWRMHAILKPSRCKVVVHAIAHSFCVWFLNNFTYFRANWLKYFFCWKIRGPWMLTSVEHKFFTFSLLKLWLRKYRGRDIGDSGNRNQLYSH